MTVGFCSCIRHLQLLIQVIFKFPNDIVQAMQLLLVKHPSSLLYTLDILCYAVAVDTSTIHRCFIYYNTSRCQHSSLKRSRGPTSHVHIFSLLFGKTWFGVFHVGRQGRWQTGTSTTTTTGFRKEGCPTNRKRFSLTSGTDDNGQFRRGWLGRQGGLQIGRVQL